MTLPYLKQPRKFVHVVSVEDDAASPTPQSPQSLCETPPYEQTGMLHQIPHKLN
jgi:hypothetical protein